MIMQMLADPARAREMAAAARQRAFENYQIGQVAEQQIALLLTLLRETPKFAESPAGPT